MGLFELFPGSLVWSAKQIQEIHSSPQWTVLTPPRTSGRIVSSSHGPFPGPIIAYSDLEYVEQLGPIEAFYLNGPLDLSSIKIKSSGPSQLEESVSSFWQRDAIAKG